MFWRGIRSSADILFYSSEKVCLLRLIVGLLIQQGLSLPRVFVAVRHITGETRVCHMADNAAAPGDLDGVLADLLHRAVAAHVEEV